MAPRMSLANSDFSAGNDPVGKSALHVSALDQCRNTSNGSSPVIRK